MYLLLLRGSPPGSGGGWRSWWGAGTPPARRTSRPGSRRPGPRRRGGRSATRCGPAASPAPTPARSSGWPELKQMKFRTINAGCQHQTAAVIHKQPRVHFAVFLFRVALLPSPPSSPSTLLLLLVSPSWCVSALVCGCLTSPNTLHINTAQHTDWMGVSCLKVCSVTHIARKINLHYYLAISLHTAIYI